MMPPMVPESDLTPYVGDPAHRATDSIARTRVYRHGVLDKEGFSVEEVSDLIGEPDTVVWIDLLEPDVEELALVAHELGLHHLAVQDAVGVRQRPKLDRYGTHEFLNMYSAILDEATGELELSEISAFITSSAIVTVRKDEAFDMDGVLERWDGSPDLARHGVGFLLYALIDHVVDGHFEAVQDLDEQIELLEDLLFSETAHGSDVQRRSFALRKSLVTLRRIVVPMREVVNSLMRRDLKLIDEDMTPYYQDVYDHVLRATEWTESLRDLVSTIVETNLTLQGNRLNVITKKVTGWAAIIAVPTAITGFYGQNVPYPGFASSNGFLWSCALILAMSTGLYFSFKRRDWL